jgi:hypothetical protein
MCNVKYRTAPSDIIQLSKISKQDKYTVELNILHAIWLARWIIVNCFALN